MGPAAPQTEIEFGIRRLRELPPVRESQQRLLKMLNADPDARDLAQAIEQCPEVAARILGLARSAYFAQRIECRSVHDAIVRILGFRLVRNLVVGLIMSGSFSPRRCPGFDSRRFWGDAVATAMFAHALTRAMRGKTKPNPDDCYVNGLLHNIGVLVLAHLWPGEMSEAFAAAGKEPERSLTDIEFEMLGIDHTGAGARLACQWHLSPEVRVVIERHRVTGYRGPFWESALLVGVSTGLGKQVLAGEEIDADAYASLEVLKVSHERFETAARTVTARLDRLAELTEVFA